MRPRVFPAEDPPTRPGFAGACEGFNEAAGIPRGRPKSARSPVRAEPASMRPRVFPAEDGDVAFDCAASRTRFNEAAGIPRGRLAARSTRGWSD